MSAEPTYLLAIEQNTTSTRAILFDADGEVRVHRAAPRATAKIYPQPGWVEHDDPEEIWQAVVATCAGDRGPRDRPSGGDRHHSQRETTVLCAVA